LKNYSKVGENSSASKILLKKFIRAWKNATDEIGVVRRASQ
jgi:FMN-dependent NADH-azoreductase